MNCQEFRAAVGAEPQRSDAAIEAHAGGCAACAAWRREMQRMDAVMRRALAIDVDAARAGGKATAQQPAWRGWALAASVACATLVAGLLWFALPRTALADEVVAHMSEEPDAWAATRLAADPARVAQVLARSGVRLAPDAGLVSYAHSCWFRGHYVPHLVFQTHAGPVTVMVLTDEHVARPVGFDEEGYGGVIVPADRGALAILSRGGQPDPGITARLRSAVSHGAR